VVESGTTDTFDVTLQAQPLTDVVISLTSEDEGQALIRPETLTFTPANCNVPQSVTATGVNNDIIAGSRIVGINVAIDDALSDAIFAALNDRVVDVTVVDDDGPGFSVTESNGTTVVDESGTTDELLIVLTQLPNSDVTLLVSIGSTDEATVDTTSLTFTPSTWNVAQPVVVTGLNDSVLDGDQLSRITIVVDAANSDDNFDTVSDRIVTVTTTDDDRATFTIVESDDSTIVSETGTEDTFQVFLNVQPASNVTLDVTSSDITEATTDVSQLLFTPVTWMIPQTVRVIGLNDVITDGDQIAPVVISVNDVLSSNAFDVAADQSVLATVIDDDIPGFTVTESSLSTQVSETGTQDIFQVRLNTQPLTDVVLSLVSLAPGDATIDEGSLVFTPVNWDVAQASDCDRGQQRHY
jgi:hypothetical protein